MDFTLLHTKRLNLRLLDPAVYTHVFSEYPDDAIKTFFHLADDEELQKEKDNFAGGIATTKMSFRYFQLLEKETGRNLGTCGFHTWLFRHQRAELFYFLHEEPDKKQGLMTEALELILDYGFNDMNLNRVEAYTATYNTPSQQLLLKFGFTKEGLLRKNYKEKDMAEDSVIYSLLKDEYDQRNAASIQS